MDREKEAGQDTGDTQGKRSGRSWTERYSGPIQYRRFVDTDAGGRRYIFIKIEQPIGQSELAQAVYEIFHQLKYLDPSPGHGSQPHATGLQFNRDRKHGRVWKVPDTPTGRTVADIIDAKLSDLAWEMEQGQHRSR